MVGLEEGRLEVEEEWEAVLGAFVEVLIVAIPCVLDCE